MEALRELPRGRYKILEQIGQGSMGAVYRARDLEADADVALKTLNDGGSLDDGNLNRLRQVLLNEASAGARLCHPGIVRVQDLIDEPGRAEIYLVMEYVDGPSLAEVLARPDPIPFDFVVKVIASVADALDHVHEHGVVHHDIKPANILIGADGRVRVTDFGIAELRGNDLAGDLQRAGSPNYMAPERVLGTSADYHGDIWALGVLLYELVTRRLPFQGESVAEVITRIASEEPAPLGAHGVAVIPGLQPIVDRALAKEPADRYQFAGDVAKELKAVQASQLSLSETLPASSIPEVDPLASETAREAGAEPELGPVAAVIRKARALWAGRRLSRRGWAAVAGTGLLALTLLLWMTGHDRAADLAQATDGASEERQRQRFEYLALLEQARVLLEKGENQAAAELFARAEKLSPDARRIRALREEARRQAEIEIAKEVEIEVAGLLGIGEADLAAGRLDEAAESLERALELDPDHSGAQALVTAIGEARAVAGARALRARVEPPAAEVVAAQPPPARDPLRVEAPIQPPITTPVATHSDLKIDFYSEVPRGIVTVYRADSQVLRRPFRFVEKKGFMRTKGVSGGFDEQVRMKAGPSDFRVYLSLPGSETQIRRISGILPPGAIRSLQLRVDAEGKLTVELH